MKEENAIVGTTAKNSKVLVPGVAMKDYVVKRVLREMDVMV